MNVIVTGCAGFIGFHLTRKLLAMGHEVTGIDDLNCYYDPRLKADRLGILGVDAASVGENVPCAGADGFVFIKSDIAEKEVYEYLKHKKYDAVCHLAAQAGVRYSITNPERYISSNIVGFFNILEYCRRNPVQRLVFASSSSVYGDDSPAPYRESGRTDHPVSLYAATKKADEVMAYSYSRLYGMNAVGLRFFTVYGPWGRPDMAPFIFTEAVLEGRPIDVFNGGELSRDFTYVDDIVEGTCMVVLDPPRHGDDGGKFRLYNIGNSDPVDLMDFIRTVEKLAGKKAILNFLPMQPGDVRTTWADISLLERDYGYRPQVPLERGLAEFVKWYRDYYGK